MRSVLHSEKRFKQKFYFLLTALILLTMLISLSLSYYFSYDNQLHNLRSQMRQTVEDKSNYLGEWLNGKVELLDVVQYYNQNDAYDCLLTSEMLTRYGISDIYEGHEDGSFKSLTGWVPPVGYDPRIRPWYQAIKKNNSLTMSDPYLDMYSKQMAVSVGLPIMKDGKFSGTLAEDILISTIITEITQLDFDKIGFVWIINERGVFVYHPDPSIIYQNIMDVNGITGIPDYKALIGDGEVQYEFNDSKRTALFREIPNSQWLLGVTVLQDLAFTNLESLKYLYFLLSIVLSFIFVAVSYFLTRILASPLMRIISFVKGITEGDLDQKIEIRFNREIDELAVSLNDMALKLKQNFTQIEEQKHSLSVYNLELENLVQERTKDIEAVNVRLQTSYETMEKQAATDFLTGISNRRSFFDMALREVSRSERESRPFCLMIADLDDFKHVNDRYGHVAGDAVLIQTVEAMKECLRSYDLLGRFGGEEFIIFLPETNREQGLKIGERIRKSIEESTVRFEDHEIKITISIGIVFRNICEECLEKVIAQADDALYSAKKSGKNRISECPD